MKNGELLSAAEAEGFDVPVTTHTNLKYQQNYFSTDCHRRDQYDELAAHQIRRRDARLVGLDGYSFDVHRSHDSMTERRSANSSVKPAPHSDIA